MTAYKAKVYLAFKVEMSIRPHLIMTKLPFYLHHNVCGANYCQFPPKELYNKTIPSLPPSRRCVPCLDSHVVEQSSVTFVYWASLIDI